MNNLERLQEAGIVAKEHKFSQEDLELIEKLTDEEVKALISVRAKLGDEFLSKAGVNLSAQIAF